MPQQSVLKYTAETGNTCPTLTKTESFAALCWRSSVHHRGQSPRLWTQRNAANRLNCEAIGQQAERIHRQSVAHDQRPIDASQPSNNNNNYYYNNNNKYYYYNRLNCEAIGQQAERIHRQSVAHDQRPIDASQPSNNNNNNYYYYYHHYYYYFQYMLELYWIVILLFHQLQIVGSLQWPMMNSNTCTEWMKTCCHYRKKEMYWKW